MGFYIEEQDLYTLNIQNEYKDLASGRNKLSNIRTTISGINNIQKYCKTNSFDTENIPDYVSFMQKFLKTERTGAKIFPLDIQKYELRFNYKEERILDKKRGLLNNILNNWNESKKTFRFIKRTTLKHNDYPFRVDCSIVKTSKYSRNKNRMISEYTIQNAELFNNIQHYEIEINFK